MALHRRKRGLYTASATAEHFAATSETVESIPRGMVAIRILDGVVRSKYVNDVGKLGA